MLARSAVLPLVCLLGACTAAAPDDAPDSEPGLRARLGIPRDARRVIIFSQSSHLDLDWQKTFDGYYRSYVEGIFGSARALLGAEPRAFYSIAEMGFLEHHLAVHPEDRAPLVEAAGRGALRIVGGGVSSPDTLLPETELLARDYLHGLAFAEDTFAARPTAAWLPDSFGHAASAPDLLAAAGFRSVGLARLDGAPTFAEALLHPDRGVRPGSNAAQLEQLGSADFMWRGAGGAELQTHWMSLHLYCTGDDLDYDEQFQLPNTHTGAFMGDDPAFTDGKIDEYVARLAPLAKTPYLFVPVGCDFQAPKEGLIEYLDGYDRRRAPSTGVWAVAGTFEDYARLVRFHRDDLPVLEGELSPYFMGFYGSRATLKRRVREAARPLYAAELLDVALGRAAPDVAAAFARLARADHHDFVTGTSTDEVLAGEQLPLCDEVEAAGRAALADAAQAIARRIPPSQGAIARYLVVNATDQPRTEIVDVPLTARMPTTVQALVAGTAVLSDVAGRTVHVPVSVPSFGWTTVELVPGASHGVPLTLELSSDRVVLSNARTRLELTRGPSGFRLTSLTVDRMEAIAAPSFTPTDYQDDGGLWRLGNEMPGCALTPLDDAASEDGVHVLERGSARVRVAFHRAGLTREVALDATGAGVTLAVESGAAEATTRTVTLALAAPRDAHLVTSEAAGYAERPADRVYTPTWWPAVSWAGVGGWAILLRQSTGVRLRAPGAVELMLARDARVEGCDVLGGTGSDPGVHRVEWRLEPAVTPLAAERAAQAFGRPLQVVAVPRLADAGAPPLAATQSLLDTVGDGVVTALKPAERGDGVIVRALLLPGPLTLQPRGPLGGRTPHASDLAERDGDATTFVLDRTQTGILTTVRLR